MCTKSLTVSGHVGCSRVLASVGNSVMNMEAQTPLQVRVLFSLNKHPGAELLGHVVVLCVSVIGGASAAAPVCLPTRVHEVPRSLHPSTLFLVFLTDAVPMGVT